MRRAALLSSFAAVLVGVACADLAGLSGGARDGGADSALTDAGVDGASTPLDAAVADSDVDPNGLHAEAGVVDASASDAACGGCDCDDDGYGVDGGDAACGGPVGDCDDSFGVIAPGTGFATNASWPSSHAPAFDWNCDGVTTKQLAYNVVCTGLLGTGCSGAGFQTNPACGTSATYVKCTQMGVSGCVAVDAGSMMQACK